MLALTVSLLYLIVAMRALTAMKLTELVVGWKAVKHGCDLPVLHGAYTQKLCGQWLSSGHGCPRISLVAHSHSLYSHLHLA